MGMIVESCLAEYQNSILASLSATDLEVGFDAILWTICDKRMSGTYLGQTALDLVYEIRSRMGQVGPFHLCDKSLMQRFVRDGPEGQRRSRSVMLWSSSGSNCGGLGGHDV